MVNKTIIQPSPPAAPAPPKQIRPKTQQAAMQWFTDMVKGVRGSAGLRKRAAAHWFNPLTDPFLGGMFFYHYDPKTKDTLPYWDAFPLVIPVSMYDDGFGGLNLHYLPPGQRAQLLTALLKYKKKAGTPQAYMKLTYPLLKNIVRAPGYEQCWHRYLTSHLRSNLISVVDDHWENAVMLPVQQFHGASSRQVWSKK